MLGSGIKGVAAPPFNVALLMDTTCGATLTITFVEADAVHPLGPVKVTV
jgi:hypothetical protein